ncbi:MAG: hypothetical protein HY690_16440 [Chloroflexi bacterium]|nr:hypothetical protein [Chloroflexota bacterium]
MACPRLLDLLDRLAGRRVLVLGDLVLDEYLVGRPGRISREAPVMVLEFTERLTRPGSASNPAANLAALGAEVRLLGVLGQDAPGQALLGQLLAAGIDVRSVIASPERTTATKTRILAEDAMGRRQQVVRLDRLPPAGLEPALVQALVEALEHQAVEVEAVLLSDYKGGVVCGETVAAARRTGRPVLVDSQGDLWRFRGCTLVKANQADAEAALGRRLDSAAAFARAGEALLHELEAESVVITRGAEGLSVFERGGRHHHIAGVPTEVFDATGAGDTVIALLGLGIAAGASLLDAARLANYAASLVVRKLGAATVSADELRALISAEC